MVPQRSLISPRKPLSLDTLEESRRVSADQVNVRSSTANGCDMFFRQVACRVSRISTDAFEVVLSTLCVVCSFWYG